MSCFCVVKKEKARRELQSQELAAEDEARLLALIAARSKIPPVRSAGEDPRGAKHGVVIQDFEACVEDEVAVQRGDCVRELFRDGDWMYVATTAGLVGFIPASYCRPISALIYPNHAPSTLERNSSTSISHLSEGASTATLTHSTYGGLPYEDSTLTRENVRTSCDRPLRSASAEPKLSARIQPLQCDAAPSSSSNSSRRDSYLDALRDNASPWPIRQPLPPLAGRNADLRSQTSRSAASTPTDMTGGNIRNSELPVAGGGFERRSRQSSIRSKLTLDVSSWSAGAARKVRMVYNFEPNSEQEVAVSKGEEVAVLSGGGRDWLYVRTRHGSEGYVPACLTASVERPGRTTTTTSQYPTHIRTANNGYTSDVSVNPAASPGADSAYVPGDSSASESDCNSSISQRSSIASSLSADSMQLSPQSGFYAVSRASASSGSRFPTSERITESPLMKARGDPAKNQSRGSSRSGHRRLSDGHSTHAQDHRPRLVVLFDYTALVSSELSVREGDVIFENADKAKKGWVWVTLPRTNEEGYIPQNFTHPYGTHLNEQDRLCTAL